MRTIALALLLSLACCTTSDPSTAGSGGSGAGGSGGAGGGSGPRLDDAGDCLAFDAVHLGDQKVLEAGVSNPGSDAVDVTLSSSGSPFGVRTQSLHLLAGESQQVQVTFAPFAEGNASGNLLLDCSGCTQAQRCLRGTGAADQVHFDPASLDFATRKDPACLDLAVVNDGLADFPMPVLEILSDPAEAFSIQGAPTAAVAPGGRATFQVCYQPGDRGRESKASLQVRAGDGGDGLATAGLRGLSGWPEIYLGSDNNNAGLHMLGETVAFDVVVRNVGQPGPLTIDRVELPADGRLTTQLPPLPVDVNNATPFHFTATPVTAGYFTASVRFHVLEEDSWRNFDMGATLLDSATCHLRFDRPEIVFPFRVPGETDEQEALAYNIGGTTCHLTDLSFDPAGSPRFSFDGTLGPNPFPLDPGSALAPQVKYDPSIAFAGDDRTTVRIGTQEGQTVTIPARPSSTYPCVTIDPRNPRVIAAEGSSLSVSIEVGNCGDADLVFEEPPTFDGEHPEWTLDSAPAAPFTIPPGSSVSFHVTFTPAWEWFHANELELWPQGDDTPIGIWLVGSVEGEP